MQDRATHIVMCDDGSHTYESHKGNRGANGSRAVLRGHSQFPRLFLPCVPRRVPRTYILNVTFRMVQAKVQNESWLPNGGGERPPRSPRRHEAGKRLRGWRSAQTPLGHRTRPAGEPGSPGRPLTG